MQSPLKRRPAIAFISLVLAQAAGAQQPPIFEGNETVVTAGRIPQRLSDTLRDVIVITARDLENAGQLTLGQVLQLYGGVEMSSNGGPGSASAVFIRGANSAHSLVLVDGMRLQSATTGTTALENIPVSEIDRIEIVPGPVSGLYGSDAIGGVIQVFTRSGRYSPGASMAAAVGSYGTGSLNASLSGAAGDTWYTVAGGWLETTGFSATKPSVPFGQYNPDKDGYRNANFSAKLDHRFMPGQEAGASVLYSKGESHFDSGPDTDPRIEQSLTSYSLHSRNQLTQAWESMLRIGSSRDDSSALNTGFPGDFRTDQDQVLWQNTLRFGTTSVIAGLEYLREDVATSTPYPVTSRTIRSAFAGVTGDYGNHGVQLNVRRDDNSQFGEPTSGSAAYGYRITPEIKLRAAIGKAFHAPSFNDLYYPGFGNPDLKPEQSRSREIGMDYAAGAQRVSATYFDNRITDLISFAFDPSTSSYFPVNVAKARIRGAELSYDARWRGTQVRALLTLQDPKSEDSGRLLQRRAKQHGSITARRDFGPWTFGAELLASGARFDSAGESPASRLHGYAVANVTAARRIADAWSVELRWNNVGDVDYELVQGYNTPGSNVLLTLKWDPK
jgi:vitamin B12 transporter